MIASKERDIILDAIYRERLLEKKGRFIIINQTMARLEAREEYEFMTIRDRIEKYRLILRGKIIDYLYRQTDRSLLFYYVNGAEGKRKMRIKEWVHYYSKTMGRNEKIAICEKLNLKYL